MSASEGRTMRCPWADCDWMVQWSEPPYDGRRAAGSLYDAHWRQKHKFAPIIEVAEPRADEGGEP